MPSDSGIGTDNNSTSDRGEKAGGPGGLAGVVGMPPGSGVLMPGVMGSAMGAGLGLNSRGRRRHSSSVLLEHPSPTPSPLGARSSPDPRRPHPATPASSLVGHKEGEPGVALDGLGQARGEDVQGLVDLGLDLDQVS